MTTPSLYEQFTETMKEWGVTTDRFGWGGMPFGFNRGRTSASRKSVTLTNFWSNAEQRTIKRKTFHALYPALQAARESIAHRHVDAEAADRAILLGAAKQFDIGWCAFRTGVKAHSSKFDRVMVNNKLVPMFYDAERDAVCIEMYITGAGLSFNITVPTFNLLISKGVLK